jgi:hypothetical protein
MKQINIYFQAVTKVSVAHLYIEDAETIEDYIRTWVSAGYCKAHYMSEKIMVYIPWSNVVYCQYRDGYNIHGDN